MTNRRVLAQPEILWIEWCKELRDDGVRFEWDGEEITKITFCQPIEEYGILEQPIPDEIKDWKAWCLKWQERGLRFEGRKLNGKWTEAKDWVFYGKKEEYRIKTQPILESFLTNEEPEMNAEEVTIKIRVSSGVDRIEVITVSEPEYKDSRPHNQAGAAITHYKKENKWQPTNQEYYIQGCQYAQQEFQRLTQPAKEMTVEEIEKALGYKVKVVGGE